MSTVVAAPRGATRALALGRRAIPWPLAVLLVLAAMQGVAWAAATAPLNGPDEDAHATYAQLLAETGHGPDRNTGDGSLSTEMDRVATELYLGAIRGHPDALPNVGGVAQFERQAARLPASARKNGTGPNSVAQNPPLYYAYAALAYRLSPDTGLLGRLFFMRLATVALFVVTVLLAWLIAAEVFASTWPRFLTAAFVALQPKLAFMSGVINADAMLIMVSTAFVLAAVRLVRRGPTPANVALLAVSTAAGPLTHGRGFALVPAAVVVLAIVLLQARPDRQTLLRLGGLAVGIVVAGLFVAVLWTRAQTGGQAFGGEVTQTGQGFSVRQLLSYVFQFYFGPFTFLQPLGPPYGYRQVYITSYFGSFASLEVIWRPFIDDLLQIVAAIGLAAFFATVCVRWRTVIARWRLWVVGVATFGSLMTVLHVSAYRDLISGSPDPLITGRYLLPCVSLYALAIAWVVHSLPRRAGAFLGCGLLAAFSVLAFGSIGLDAVRFYA